MQKLKLLRVTTIPLSLNVLLKGQLAFLNRYFNVIGVSGSGNDMQQVAEREGIETRVVEIEREISVKKDMRSLTQLIKLFRKENPAIVHANTPKGSLLSLIAAKITGVPYRIYTLTGIRFETERGLKRRILIAMERITCFCATHLIAESKGVKRMIEEHNLSSKKAVIVGNGNINGIDETFWDPALISSEEKHAFRQKYNIADNDVVLLFVGRLVKDKGVTELVNAFSKLSNRPDVKLLLVGPTEPELDPLAKDVLQIIETNGSIISVGFQKDVRLFMANAQMLILPSYREGFPNVILQAGAMGLPCIVTDVNGAEDVIDEKNGMIIDKRNGVSLMNAILKMLDTLPEYDKNYCRSKVVTLFAQSYYYPKLLEFYNNLINKQS